MEAVHAASSTTNVPESLAKPPPALEFGANKEEAFIVFFRRWNNYTKLSNFETKYQRDIQIAIFENCLGLDAMKAYDSFQFDNYDERTIAEIIQKFRLLCVGDKNVTFERYIFNQRIQEDGEEFENFLSAIRLLSKSCDFCPKCVDSMVRDRIIVGLNNKDTQSELLKIKNVSLTQTIDICKVAESAALQKRKINAERINKIKQADQKPRRIREGLCNYCGQHHRFLKEDCPAWGKTCDRCGRRNHFGAVCKSARDPEQKRHTKKIHAVTQDEQPDEEWINVVQTRKPTQSKDIKCRMEVDGHPLIFQIDTGASVNMLPEKHATNIIPYEGNLQMWNGATVQPVGKCRKSLRNPKTKKRYNVEFVVFEGQCQPLIGLRASQQMGLIKIEDESFDRVALLESDTQIREEIFEKTLGTLPGKPQVLHTAPNATPKMMGNRRVPIALRPKLKAELERLTNMGVIRPINEPTPWVSQLALTEKKSGELRICIDPHELNKVLQRERYTMPLLEDMLHLMKDSRVFSKADLSSGYWHVKLDEQSSKLTTFQTDYGRYCWNRLPFGLNVSAEIFQRRLLEVFKDLPGVLCIADDVVIHGRTLEEHNENLAKFFTRCKSAGIRLNREKFEQGKQEITFMGHRISQQGLQSDPEKSRAITAMPRPTNITELRRFWGMVNYLSKFLPNVADIMQPLHNLLKKDVEWSWSPTQEEAFINVKQLIAKAPTLLIYDPDKPLVLENDASESGIGSVLTQEGHPVAFASRTLSETERRYAQIEKEMLAVVFGLEKFHNYTYGREIIVITDHKPLEAICEKPLSKAPRRLQSLILRANNYRRIVKYRPGKAIPVADALSRASVNDPHYNEIFTINNVTLAPEFREDRLEKIRQQTAEDNEMQALAQTIINGWPEHRSQVNPTTAMFFSYRDELTVMDGIIFKGERIVIPTNMRNEMKQRAHAGHIGINASLRRARDLIFWPNMSSDIRQYIENCGTCATYACKQPNEPWITTEIPNYAWSKVAVDLFTWGGKDHLITVDYFSGFFEIDELRDTTSETVILKLKSHFSRYGIPDELISDNGPQFSGWTFSLFAKHWHFIHKRISPGNSQANGAVEAAVKIAKQIMRRCKASDEDLFLGLLNYRNSPSEGLSTSPAQRLLGRRTRSLLPMKDSLLLPTNRNTIEKDRELKNDRKSLWVNKSTARKKLDALRPDDVVRMEPLVRNNREWREGTVRKALTQRSYEVTCGGKTYRRNRRHLRRRPKSTHSIPASCETAQRGMGMMYPDPSQVDYNSSPKENTTTEGRDPTSEKHNHHGCDVNRRIPDKENNSHSREEEEVRTRSGRLVKKVDRMDL